MTDHPAVICGARENRPDGSWECVQPPEHPDRPHYWVRLVTGRRGG